MYKVDMEATAAAIRATHAAAQARHRLHPREAVRLQLIDEAGELHVAMFRFGSAASIAASDSSNVADAFVSVVASGLHSLAANLTRDDLGATKALEAEVVRMLRRRLNNPGLLDANRVDATFRNVGDA